MDGIDLNDWLEQVEDVLAGCASDSVDPAELLSQTHHLLTTGPFDLCAPIKPAISSQTLRQLLDAEAFESAALRLVQRCGYMLSGTAQGTIIASIVLPSAERDYSYNASSEAIALCGALATCLQERVIAGPRMDQTILRRMQN
jgi:hypothetical protein